MNKILKIYPLSILIILAIIVLSLINTPESSLNSIRYTDKIAHFFIYFSLELILLIEYDKNHKCFPKNNALVLILIFPILFGGLMELGQKYLTKTRSAEWLDFAANSTGVLVAAVIIFLLFKPLKNRLSKR